MNTMTNTDRTYTREEIDLLISSQSGALPVGYNAHDYFDDEGRYLGPDQDGIEPRFDWDCLPDKHDAEDWEIIATYYEAVDTDDGESLVATDVMIGEAAGRWYARTTDDAGGSDDAQDDPIGTSEKEAREWVDWFVDRNDGTPTSEIVIAEIRALEWFDASVTNEDIESIANAIPGTGSEAFPVWISNRGGVHMDHSRNTIRVEGWDDYIVVGGADGGIEGALMAIRNAIVASESDQD